MMKTIPVSIGARTEFIDVTGKVQQVIKESGVKDGTCTVYVPHTTAAVTINENADPSVRRDILSSLNRLIPFDDNYSHSEGNSAAHIKASIIGSSETIIVVDGRLALGTWQGIYYCEFDGPRRRTLLVQVT